MCSLGRLLDEALTAELLWTSKGAEGASPSTVADVKMIAKPMPLDDWGSDRHIERGVVRRYMAAQRHFDKMQLNSLCVDAGPIGKRSRMTGVLTDAGNVAFPVAPQVCLMLKVGGYASTCVRPGQASLSALHGHVSVCILH